jgi:hypothetical protein
VTAADFWQRGDPSDIVIVYLPTTPAVLLQTGASGITRRGLAAA